MKEVGKKDEFLTHSNSLSYRKTWKHGPCLQIRKETAIYLCAQRIGGSMWSMYVSPFASHNNSFYISIAQFMEKFSWYTKKEPGFCFCTDCKYVCWWVVRLWVDCVQILIYFLFLKFLFFSQPRAFSGLHITLKKVA